MAADADVPDEFDVYTVVLLRRPPEAPELSDAELDALQERHLAYRAHLAREGLTVANGPFDEQSDPTHRGMSVFACGPEEAARLSDADPSVVAGRLAYDVMEWWVRAGSLAFPLAGGPVGERRRMTEG
ncbi:YciI family protein [Terrabacter terrigena]|uniref:YciI family protein n=1 Tax=Terrabacter terrigena TaxID=574718 RepID=A0ABW3N270_9MICO